MQAFTAYTGLTLEEMQEHTELLINAFDAGHRVIFWNRCCADFFGIAPKDALGKKLEDLLPFTAGNDKRLRLDMALMGQEIIMLNEHYETRDGQYEQRVIPIRNEQGKVVAALNIVRDLKVSSHRKT